MRKLNGSNVITGFQSSLCSHYAACAQENGPKSYRQKCSNFKTEKLNFSVNIEDFQKNLKSFINYILVSITWHHLNDDITYSNFFIYLPNVLL